MVTASGSPLRQLLIDRYATIRDGSTGGYSYINEDGWWRSAEILQLLPAALAEPFLAHPPSVVVGPQSSGYVLGPLVARHLNVGFVGARKGANPLADSDAGIRVTTPPDYQDRHIEFGFRRGAISVGARVLIVDDWVDTGSQLLALQRLVHLADAEVVGTTVIADALTDRRVRRDLNLTSLVQARELWG